MDQQKFAKTAKQINVQRVISWVALSNLYQEHGSGIVKSGTTTFWWAIRLYLTINYLLYQSSICKKQFCVVLNIFDTKDILFYLHSKLPKEAIYKSWAMTNVACGVYSKTLSRKVDSSGDVNWILVIALMLLGRLHRLRCHLHFGVAVISSFRSVAVRHSVTAGNTPLAVTHTVGNNRLAGILWGSAVGIVWVLTSLLGTFLTPVAAKLTVTREITE
jgi:hypothetical protein